jgi:hypothetical protein
VDRRVHDVLFATDACRDADFKELCRTLNLSNNIQTSAAAMIEEMRKSGSEEVKVR